MSLLEEKICKKPFFSLGELTLDEHRGMIFTGARKISPFNGERHFYQRMSDFEILVDGKFKKHPHTGYELIGGKLVWSAGRDENCTLFREDGLKLPITSGYSIMDIGGKLACIIREGKRDKPQRLWVEGETGPLCNAIYDVILTSKGIGYTAFLPDTFHCMLNNKKFGDPDCSTKLFEHDGKLGCVVFEEKDGKETERVYFDGKPYGEPGQDIWMVRSINGKLIHVIQSGSVFQSGTIEKGLMAGMPMFDLSKNFGYHTFIDNKHVASSSDAPDFIQLGNKIGIKLEHYKNLTDPNPSTELLVVDGNDIQRFKFNGTGYINSVGNKIAFNQCYHGNGPKAFLEDKLVLDGVHKISGGYDGLVDVEGKIGTVVQLEKNGPVCPSIDGKVSGEPIPAAWYSMPEPLGVFGGNVIAKGDFVLDAAEEHLSVQGKTYGPFLAVSSPAFKDGKLHFIVSKEDGTYLWTFKDGGKK